MAKNVFDKSKDKMIFEKKLEAGISSNLIIGVYKYGDGDMKIGISRTVMREGIEGESFTKLGRLTSDEAEMIIPVLNECLDVIRKKK